MNKRKIVKRAIFILILLVGIAWTILNLNAWRYCLSGYYGHMTIDKQEAIENKSLIAIFKTKSEIKYNTIQIQRMQWRIPWKYLYYTPKFYSSEFYISTYPANTEYILAGQDTLMTRGPFPFNQLPAELKVYLSNSAEPIIYSLDEKFQTNIDNIASVPFFEKIDSGPFLNDD
jgi:hypothetical protein